MILARRDSGRISAMLAEGKVGILPTDTVYGFSAIASPEAEMKIRLIKGRSDGKPFIRLIDAPQRITEFSSVEIPDFLLRMWPGPLTLIVPAGSGSAAFRCPGDGWLRDIIAACGSPIFSTSANRSGSPVLEKEQDIIEEFGRDCDFIVADGDKPGGIPSTIVSILDGAPKVLRQGALRMPGL